MSFPASMFDGQLAEISASAAEANAAIVRRTNKRVVLQCPSEDDARFLVKLLKLDRFPCDQPKRGLRTQNWYVQTFFNAPF
jgi:hypothetical protein